MTPPYLRASGKQSRSFLTNFKRTYHGPQLIPGVHRKEIKAYVHTKTCIQMFTAALLLIASNRKQSKYPSTEEWINKLW